MPTVRTVTVKSSGGDYTSLAAAEAGEQGNLVTLDRQTDIECYASAAGDSTQVTIDGWTTDATRYIRFVCPAGERHAGVWDASKYHLTLATSGSPGGCITIREAYTRIEYLQVRNTRASAPDFNDAIYSEGTFVLVDGCITRGGYRSIRTPGAGSEIRNCIAYEGVRSGMFIQGTSGGFSSALNCTAIGALYGLESSASVNYPQAKNVYAHGGTWAFATGTGAAGGSVAKTNCMSSDTTATNNTGGGGATNCTNSVAHSTANFTNVTSGSESYLLPSGSALIDAGVDLSATFTNDINGTTRPQGSGFDVGADEYAAVGGGVTENLGTVSTTSSGVTPTTTLSNVLDATSTTSGIVNPTTTLVRSLDVASSSISVVSVTTSISGNLANTSSVLSAVTPGSTLSHTLANTSSTFSVVTPASTLSHALNAVSSSVTPVGISHSSGIVESPGSVEIATGVSEITTELATDISPIAVSTGATTPTTELSQQISSVSISSIAVGVTENEAVSTNLSTVGATSTTTSFETRLAALISIATSAFTAGPITEIGVPIPVAPIEDIELDFSFVEDITLDFPYTENIRLDF